jgi:hypothetical protein
LKWGVLSSFAPLDAESVMRNVGKAQKAGWAGLLLPITACVAAPGMEPMWIPGVEEAVEEVLIPDEPKCVDHGWVMDPRPLDEILPADQNAPGRLQVVRRDSTTIDLLRPFLRDDKIVGWDADDSRIDHRPFTLIPMRDVLQVASWKCVRWEEP